MSRLVVCMFAVFMFMLASCGAPPAPPAVKPPLVHVLTVTREDIPVTKTIVGRTMARQTVDLRCNVVGYLKARPFAEGGMIRAGDVLFRIDPSDYTANLDTARAKLEQAKAKQAQAETDLRRIEPLANAGATPMQDLDNARTNLLSAKADVRAAKAAVTSAEIALSYTTISAPFAGRISKATVDLGTLVSPQTGVLATLDQVDPIAVEFTISEQEMLKFRSDMSAGRIIAPAPDHFPVQATLLDGTLAPGEGRIDFADIRIRPETGTALLRAVFPNSDSHLVPGQFIRVGLIGIVRKDAVLVPQGAVLQSPTGASIYILAADGTAQSKTVTLGEWIDNRWLINAGLRGGETVIVDGVQKVRAGMKVTVDKGEAGDAKKAATEKEQVPATKPQ